MSQSMFDFFPTRSSASVSLPKDSKSTSCKFLFVSCLSFLFIIICLVLHVSAKLKQSTKKATPSKRNIEAISLSPTTLETDSINTPPKRTRSETKKAVPKKPTTIKTAKTTVKKNSKFSFGGSQTNSVEIYNDLASTTSNKPTPSEKPKSTALNSEQIREKLKNCKNLSQLRENLATINGCAEKLKQFKEIKVTLSPVKPAFTKSPQKFRTPEKLSVSGLSVIPSPLQAFNSPSLLPRQKHTTPVSNLLNPETVPKPSCSRRLFAEDASEKASNVSKKDTVPAYQRYAKAVDEKFTFPIPFKYRELVTLFDRMDFLVENCQKRHERCTLDKLTTSIEATTQKKFDVNVLKKILSVGEPGRWFKVSYDVVDGSCKLVIESNDKRRDSLDAITLHTTRVTEFHECLLDIVKVKHLQFLGKMNLSIDGTDKIYRWHPMFEVESIEDVSINEEVLPKYVKATTTKSKQANSILNYFPKKSESNFDAKKNEDTPSTNPTEVGSPKTVQKGVLKGVSLDLLNKVGLVYIS